MPANDKVYSRGEITQRLEAELPRWTLTRDGIRRKYKTAGWKASLMVVNAVGHLAEAAWHHPDLQVSYKTVLIDLTTHSAKGVTAKDFELARKIEEVVGWRPAAAGILDGTPDDPCVKYLDDD